MRTRDKKPPDLDPIVTNPEHYKVIFENDLVRVLDFTDQPGDSTAPHVHQNSVMVTLSSFRRRLKTGDRQRDLDIAADEVMWLRAQEFEGENTGDTPTHVIFVEVKNSGDILPWLDLGPV